MEDWKVLLTGDNGSPAMGVFVRTRSWSQIIIQQNAKKHQPATKQKGADNTKGANNNQPKSEKKGHCDTKQCLAEGDSGVTAAQQSI